MISFSFLSKRRGATPAGIFSLALSCVVLLCGAGSAPIENFLPQGAMQGDLNAGGHNLTNAATVYATTVNAANVVVSGSLTAPSSFILPFSQLTSTPTTLSGYGITDAEHALGNPSTSGYVLSSTTGGTRSWIAPGGSLTLDSTAEAVGFSLSSGTLYLSNVNDDDGLVQLDVDDRLPAVDGSQLTGLTWLQIGNAGDLASGLLAFWNMEDLSDNSGNGWTLTNNGGVTFGTGLLEDAAIFNGSDDLNTSLSVDSDSAFTVTGWFNPSTLGSNHPIVCQFAGSSGLEWVSNLNPDGSMQVSSSSASSAHTSGTATAGQWSFFCLTYNGGVFSLSINNGTPVTLTEAMPSGTSAFTIGGYSDGPSFSGSIDAVGVWNRVLTSGEISTLYNSGSGVQSPLPTAPLFNIGASNPPASSGSSGIPGQITWDSNYLYVCVAANTWKRVALSTW